MGPSHPRHSGARAATRGDRTGWRGLLHSRSLQNLHSAAMSAQPMRTLPFMFSDSPQISDDSTFKIDLPPALTSKSQLLEAMASAAHFPSYFGLNWDGLSDCLRDFHWITQRKIAVVHSDVPLQISPGDCKIYLEILSDAVHDWRSSAAAIPPSSPEHDFQVVFPAASEKSVREILGA